MVVWFVCELSGASRTLQYFVFAHWVGAVYPPSVSEFLVSVCAERAELFYLFEFIKLVLSGRSVGCLSSQRPV